VKTIKEIDPEHKLGFFKPDATESEIDEYFNNLKRSISKKRFGES